MTRVGNARIMLGGVLAGFGLEGTANVVVLPVWPAWVLALTVPALLAAPFLLWSGHRAKKRATATEIALLFPFYGLDTPSREINPD